MKSQLCGRTACPCRRFISEDDVTSAIETDAQTVNLIAWLSGNDESSRSPDDASISCTHRLSASIVFLNAIRDACRPHLGTTSIHSNYPVLHQNESKPSMTKESTVYEDSFPPLPSAASSVTPTLLLPRRKTVERKKKVSRAGAKDCRPNGHLLDVDRSNNSETGNPRAEKSVSSSNSTNGEINIKVSSHHPFQQDSPHCHHKITGANNDKCKKTQTTIGTFKDEQNLKIIEDNRLIRLVDVYTTILRNRLASHILLELHLLIRLVSVSNKVDMSSIRNGRNPQQLAFSDILHSPESCRKFGISTMSALEVVIVNLSYDVLKMFASLEILQIQCPKLFDSLQNAIDAGTSELLFETGQKALGEADTPHITLPFDPDRDSRHNYRTAELSRLYQERESLRDGFLFQLRAFRDVRGRLLDEEQSRRVIHSIENESRRMLKETTSGNISWFVTFFCDLLLQLGLIPIGETDCDVLKQVADQKRLQKLHKRFTSRGGHVNKSSTKLTIDQSRSLNPSVDSLAEYNFRGHQEFFVIFLNAGDSYQFNCQLRGRLARLVTEMVSVKETKGLCQHIAKTQLLAKFLGFLVFSPNWYNDHSSLGTNQTIMRSLGESEFPPIDLKVLIEAAWIEYRLVVVIPCVLEFLKMMKWDAISKTGLYYFDVFTLLWNIIRLCYPPMISEHSYLQTNMTLVSIQLVTFFLDVVGLEPSWNFPTVTLSFRCGLGSESTDSDGPTPLDLSPLWFGKSFLCSSTLYFEDLFDLVDDIRSTNSTSLRSGGSGSKKIKPFSISLDPLEDLAEISWQRTPTVNRCLSIQTPWLSSQESHRGTQDSMKDKLIDSFFHRHKDLQHLCGTIIDCVLKNFSTSISHTCISPMFRNGATDYEEYFCAPKMKFEEYMELLQSLDVNANMAAQELMKDEFNRSIRGSLDILAPRTVNPRVLGIASSLAIQHATHNGDQVIRSIIQDKKKKLADEFIRRERKVSAGAICPNNKTMESINMNAQLTDIQCLREFSDLLVSLEAVADNETFLKSVKCRKEVVIKHLQTFHVGKTAPPSVTNFESQFMSMCKAQFLSQQSFLSMRAVMESLDVFCLLGKLGYLHPDTSSQIESLIGDPTKTKVWIRHIFDRDEDQVTGSPAASHIIGVFFARLLDGSFLGQSALENVLINLMREVDYFTIYIAVAEATLHELAINSGFTCWTNDGFVLMVRLQKEVRTRVSVQTK